MDWLSAAVSYFTGTAPVATSTGATTTTGTISSTARTTTTTNSNSNNGNHNHNNANANTKAKSIKSIKSKKANANRNATADELIVTEKISGLENLGNTCFFNVCVQALLSCPKFVEYLMHLSQEFDREHQKSSSASSASSSHRLCAQLLLDCYEGRIKTPAKLFQLLCAFHPTEFSSFTQSDAHESLNKLLEILEMEEHFIRKHCRSTQTIADMLDFIGDVADDGNANANARDEEKDDEEAEEEEEDEEEGGDTANPGGTRCGNNNNLIKNPLQGLLQNSIKCAKCGFQNELRQTSFMCLSIPLDDGVQRSSFHLDTLQLTKLIDKFQSQERIENYRCLKCEAEGFVQHIRNLLAVLLASGRVSD